MAGSDGRTAAPVVAIRSQTAPVTLLPEAQVGAQCLPFKVTCGFVHAWQLLARHACKGTERSPRSRPAIREPEAQPVRAIDTQYEPAVEHDQVFPANSPG